MSTEIKLEGTEQMAQLLQKLGAEARAKVEDAVTKAAVNVRGRAVRKINQGPNTGRFYTSKVANKQHQASAPGEAPATDSGQLVSSIYWEQDGTTAYVGSPLMKAVYLEFGTRKMEPRPFLFPSLEEERPSFHRDLKKVLDV
jgi:HK97 gp10 family phage protein